jgi:hypothetical protein
MESAPEILGIGIIAAVISGLAAVWYLKKKGYREAEANRRSG